VAVRTGEERKGFLGGKKWERGVCISDKSILKHMRKQTNYVCSGGGKGEGRVGEFREKGER